MFCQEIWEKVSNRKKERKFLDNFDINICMNKIFLFTFAALLLMIPFCSSAQGARQHGNFDRDAFIAKRNAFITSEAGLTNEEAAAFIPLINELQKKMFDIGHEYRQMARSLKQKTDASDAEYTRTVEAGLNAELKQAQLQKEYYEKFKKILSPKKIYLYKRAELKFAREFMKGGDKR
jgi:Spy/CpxP family protein refolding chaperone